MKELNESESWEAFPEFLSRVFLVVLKSPPSNQGPLRCVAKVRQLIQRVFLSVGF